MLAWILDTIAAFCEHHGNFINITGTADDTDVYLIRYYVIPRNKWFNIYIHRFLRSDRDDFHDHPWRFWTWIARGSYREEVATSWMPRKRQWRMKINYRSRYANSFVSRKPTDLHRVILDRQYLVEEKMKAPMTLCITGPVVREWGFVKDGQWINWKSYLGLPEDTESRG